MMERLRAPYLEPGEGGAPLAGVTTEAFDAVLATQPRSPLDFDARLRALLGFLALPEAASLAAANRRIANLLSKSAGGGIRRHRHRHEQRLASDAERSLFDGRAGGRALGAGPHRGGRLRRPHSTRSRACARRSMRSSTT